MRMKKYLTISRRKIGRAVDQFVRSFGSQSEDLEREYKNRLREIVEELERERKRETETEQEENYKH